MKRSAIISWRNTISEDEEGEIIAAGNGLFGAFYVFSLAHLLPPSNTPTEKHLATMLEGTVKNTEDYDVERLFTAGYTRQYMVFLTDAVKGIWELY